MDWLGIIVAGLVGTAVITALMYAGPMMGMPKMDIAQIQGSMVLPMGTTAFAVGMVTHFMMGIVFTAIYALVWDVTDLDVTWWSGLIFGAVHAMVAAAGMAMMVPFHKEMKAGNLDSPFSGGAKSMMGMLMGHLVFGLVVALVYGAYV